MKTNLGIMAMDDFIMEGKRDLKLSLMPNEMPENLFILWNIGSSTVISIDGHSFEINKYCMVFLSELHLSVSANFEEVRVIEFSKAFLGIDSSLNQVGDFLQVFYGYHFLDKISKIELRNDQVVEFEQLWQTMKEESERNDDLISKALLRNSFQRLMLLSQKAHMRTEFDLPIDYMNLRVIREFQYLVEMKFMQLTQVSDYADILKVPAKRLSELFKKYYNRRPLDLINHRRNLHARKQLMHTHQLVKNIAYELNFADSQAFIHFFKKMNGVAPDGYRKKHLASEK